ncbi:MAG: lysine--tRNA ligase [Rickettsiales bacterium]|nr:lysine--tRNA ligase [Rickettsiales bacterium]
MERLKEIGQKSKSWAFQEATQVLKRLNGKTPEKGYVLFETGYGPSGLPHIGTFGEVARTQMVRHAFEQLSDIPTKLFCISDDMDGLRKVPDNIPNQELIAENLGKPLTDVPDPFETHDSYGAHMNHRLREFLDHFGFQYEFKSATDCYKDGVYDEKLLALLKNYQKVMDVMLPTLGKERQQTYSPFLPICQKTGKVLYVPMESVDAEKGLITYRDDEGELIESEVTGGKCKLQWKPDMGMRWAAFDVDFEMYGKDHLASAPLYTKICRLAGGNPPYQYKYELFLDAQGQKISKSKGNGLTIEEWLRYAPSDSLALFMYQSPNKAKRLSFDVIPKQMDEYLQHLNAYPDQELDKQISNPVWHIHNGNPPVVTHHGLSFSLLLNLASACNPEDKSVLWGFISRYVKGATPETAPLLDQMAGYAVTYYHDFIKPNKQFRKPTDQERAALESLSTMLQDMEAEATPEDIQNDIYAIGRQHEFDPMRNWFKALYEVLLGASQGPRFGSFVALYGPNETKKLVDDALTV